MSNFKNVPNGKLPIKSNLYSNITAILRYESMGIIIIDELNDLFYNVVLPEGWKIKKDGGYWSYVYDDTGKEVMSFFYKGAFYDRDAFVNFNKEDK